MWTKPGFLTAAALTSLIAVSATASPLTARLLYPQDLPSGCKSMEGLFPNGPKTEALYNYTAYQSVLPKLTDRHAQSFACGADFGSVYYFQYAAAADKDSAMLFAKPVVGKEASTWIEWSTGFALVSFKNPPASLVTLLQAKASGSTPPPPPTTTAQVLPTVAAPSNVVPTIAVSPGPTESVRRIEAALPSSTVLSASSSTEPPAVSSAAIAAMVPSAPPVGVKDVSDDVLNTLLENLACDSKSPSETRKVCGWVKDFKSGTAPTGVINSSDVLVGEAYRVDSYGRLNEKFFNVLIGNGQVGGVAVFPVNPANSLETFEGQTLADARVVGKPLPPNRLRYTIAGVPRPTQSTVTMVNKSWALDGTAEKRLFLRQKGNLWLILGVASDNPDEQTRSSYFISTVY